MQISLNEIVNINVSKLMAITADVFMHLINNKKNLHLCCGH